MLSPSNTQTPIKLTTLGCKTTTQLYGNAMKMINCRYKRFSARNKSCDAIVRRHSAPSIETTIPVFCLSSYRPVASHDLHGRCLDFQGHCQLKRFYSVSYKLFKSSTQPVGRCRHLERERANVANYDHEQAKFMLSSLRNVPSRAILIYSVPKSCPRRGTSTHLSVLDDILWLDNLTQLSATFLADTVIRVFR